MTDSSRINHASRPWAGIDKSVIADEFRAALKAADTNGDGRLSRTQFNSVATQLGLTAIEANSAFDTATGSGTEIHIAAFVAVTGADMVLQHSEILAIVRQNDSDKDGKISKAEFEKIAKDIAKDMGVNAASPARIDAAYSGIAGSGSSATVDDVLAYFAAFAHTAGAYDEAAFTTIVNCLGGSSPVMDAGDAAGTADPARVDLRSPMGANADWNEAEEFAPMVTRLERHPALRHALLATGGLITLARIPDHYRDAETALDGPSVSGEFAQLAARIDLGHANPARFASMAGSGGVIALAELTGFLDPPGLAGPDFTTWAEA